jgi:hypothetical protein|tara:strand:- start:210 stop:464 length:255 start_codon:yes stop_codon:yes gene_type:complete
MHFPLKQIPCMEQPLGQVSEMRNAPPLGICFSVNNFEQFRPPHVVEQKQWPCLHVPWPEHPASQLTMSAQAAPRHPGLQMQRPL